MHQDNQSHLPNPQVGKSKMFVREDVCTLKCLTKIETYLQWSHLAFHGEGRTFSSLDGEIFLPHTLWEDRLLLTLLEVCHVRSEVMLNCNFNIHQLIRKFRLMQTFSLTYRHPPSFLLQKKLHSCNRVCCCLSLSVSKGRYWVNPGLQQRREVGPAFLLQALTSGAAILISAPWRSADKP